MDGAPDSPARRRAATLLFLILLSGTIFRVAGLSSGYQRVDDYVVARQIVQNYLGDWRPDFVYFYPNFFDYLVALGLRVLNVLFRLVGVQRGPGLYPFSLEQVLFAARLLSALLGSATVLIVYGIGRRLYSAAEGRLAAFLYSVAFIPILFSHQVALDVPMTFFFALSLYFCVGINRDRRLRDYLLAGFLGGLAVATKYNGIFIFAAVFLSHLLSRPATMKKLIPRAFFDRKLALAAAAGIAGFFAGHPYALLKFKTFLGATRLLLQGVHETEWFLTPIQPKTWLEHIAYNKQVLALKNIFTGEGPVFLALILVGVAAVCLRRNRRTAWLALSGLAYFIGAISYLGFSRHRDLPAFAVFYAFLAMSGIGLIRDLGRRSKPARTAAALVVAASLAALEFGAWRKSFYLWEDDTTEIAERWIRRNVPETSYIGKEWFTPPLREREPRYETFSRPYIFSRDFAPYTRFDYLITSSAAYGHFFKNAKFYPEHLRLYKSLGLDHERVKDFFFWDIEYKNPELNIYRMGSRGRKKTRLELPLSIPWDDQPREFECLDGSPYGKSPLGFFLEDRQTVRREIISREKVGSLAVFVSGSDGEGSVEIGHGGLATKLNMEPGKTAVLVLNPRRAFPFYRYLYRVFVKGTGIAGSVFVRIAADDFEIGSEFYRLGRWTEARVYLLRALEGPFPQARDFEVFAKLAACCRELGRAAEAEGFAARAVGAPLFRRYRALAGPAEDEAVWRRRFERYSGLDLGLFETLQSNRVRASEMEREGNAEVRFISAAKRLLPQRYKIRPRFAGAAAGPGRLEVVSGTAEAESRQVLEFGPGGPAGAAAPAPLSAEVREPGAEVRFEVVLDRDGASRFLGLDIFPDVRAFIDLSPLPLPEAASGPDGRRP